MITWPPAEVIKSTTYSCQSCTGNNRILRSSHPSQVLQIGAIKRSSHAIGCVSAIPSGTGFGKRSCHHSSAIWSHWCRGECMEDVDKHSRVHILIEARRVTNWSALLTQTRRGLPEPYSAPDTFDPNPPRHQYQGLAKHAENKIIHTIKGRCHCRSCSSSQEY